MQQYQKPVTVGISLKSKLTSVRALVPLVAMMRGVSTPSNLPKAALGKERKEIVIVKMWTL